MMQIPKWPVATEREMRLLREVLEGNQWVGFHEFVERFEKSFAAFQHCRHGVSAANGTLALEMAMAAAGIAISRARVPLAALTPCRQCWKAAKDFSKRSTNS